MTDPADDAPIPAERCELVLVVEPLLRSLAAPDGRPDWGDLEPPSVETLADLPAARRLEQVTADRSVAPWLLRLIVCDGRVAGHVGGHDRPDGRGMVEIGYTLDPAFRGRGLATEAARAWFGWAHERGARIARLSFDPGNEPSIAIGRRLGLHHVSDEWDEDDQVWEQVWEAALPLVVG
jgi:RimJ/RimL family protein N-acetyltransferase